MRCPVFCVTFEMTTGVSDSQHKVEPHYFKDKKQAEFYFNARLEKLRKSYSYAIEESKKPNSPWTLFDQGRGYWSLSSTLAKVDYTLRYTETCFELEGPDYVRLEELVYMLVDQIYDTHGTEEASNILRNSIGMDEYEMLLFGYSSDPEEDDPEADSMALAPDEKGGEQ